MFIVPSPRTAAQLAAPECGRFGRAVRGIGRVGAGELGGEDTFDGLVHIGTREHYRHIRRHYSEPEQEMFPTARYDYRCYTVYGLPPRRELAVHMSREWIAGELRAAGVSPLLTMTARLKAKIIKE